MEKNMLVMSKDEHEALLRDSERLKVLREYVASRDFIASDDVKVLLGIETRKESKNEYS